MSHRSDCPDRWEARREGERAFERGYGSNPYRDSDYSESYEDRRCREEAEAAWRSGYYAAEEREQERRREEAYRSRCEEEAAEEAAYLDALHAQAAASEQFPEPDYPEPPEPPAVEPAKADYIDSGTAKRKRDASARARGRSARRRSVKPPAGPGRETP